MAVKFYKKLSPETEVVVLGKFKLKFDTLDHVVGYYATDKPEVWAEFEKFMREQRYCISEISESEFHENFVKKKATSSPLRPDWREEISKGTRSGEEPMERIKGPLANAVRVEGCDGHKAPPCASAMGDARVVAAAEVPPTPKEFKPPVGRRTRATRTKPTPAEPKA